jgi:hypothetical protein
MPNLLDPLSRFVPVFMEGDGTTTGGGTTTGQTATQTQTTQTQTAPAGKVFSEDYVESVRRESAGYRTRAKGYEEAVRNALGLKPEDNLPNDIPAALAALKASGAAEVEQTKTLAKGALLKAAFLTAAAGKVADSDDAYLLAGSLLAGIEVDLATGAVTVPAKDGKARTLADIVTDLLTAKPHLKAGGQGAGVGGTATGGGSGNAKPTPAEQAAEIAKSRTQTQSTKKSFWD